MEDQRFDTLAKRLAGPISRRQVLKAIVATALGGLLLRSGSGAALADNSDCAHFCNAIYPSGDAQGHCKSDAARGHGVCTQCGPAAPVGHPNVCGVGTNTAFCCPPEQPSCCDNRSCLDLQTDLTHCGTCDNACPPAPANATEQCVAGACTFVCNGGFTQCGNQCVDLNSDANNCGACGNACAPGASCTNSTCQGTLTCTPATFPNFAPCNNNPSCICFRTAENGSFCFDTTSGAGCGMPCLSSSQCGPSQVCLIQTGCPGFGTCISISTACASSGAPVSQATAQNARPHPSSGVTQGSKHTSPLPRPDHSSTRT